MLILHSFVLSHCNFLTMFPTGYSSVANPQWQVVLAFHVCAQLLGSTSTYYILITYHLSLCGPMYPTLVYLWCFSLSLSKITSVIGPSGVRMLHLGCRQKRRWPLSRAFFALSLFSLLSLRLITNSPRRGCSRVSKICMSS